jgi:hypothetical protein
MRIPVVLALGLAIGFALPTFAQQTNTPDPQLREQLLALAGERQNDWEFLTLKRWQPILRCN